MSLRPQPDLNDFLPSNLDQLEGNRRARAYDKAVRRYEKAVDRWEKAVARMENTRDIHQDNARAAQREIDQATGS